MSAYWQIPINDMINRKLFLYPQRFKYNVMAFGLANTPGIFQDLMSTVLHNMEDFALACLGDILIFSPTLEKHI